MAFPQGNQAAGTLVEKERTPVVAALNALENSLSELSMFIDQLERRIEAGLGPPEPRAEKNPSVPPPMAPMSGLRAVIKSQTERVQDISARIDGIIARVEL